MKANKAPKAAVQAAPVVEVENDTPTPLPVEVALKRMLFAAISEAEGILAGELALAPKRFEVCMAYALEGYNLERIKSDCQCHDSWPTQKNGKPVGEKAAIHTLAGIFYNRTRVAFSRYEKDADGVPLVSTDKDGKQGFIIKQREQAEKVEHCPEPATTPATAPIQPEQQNQDAWIEVLGAISPEQFDRIRATLETLGCPSHLLKLAA